MWVLISGFTLTSRDLRLMESLHKGHYPLCNLSICWPINKHQIVALLGRLAVEMTLFVYNFTLSSFSKSGKIIRKTLIFPRHLMKGEIRTGELVEGGNDRKKVKNHCSIVNVSL